MAQAPARSRGSVPMATAPGPAATAPGPLTAGRFVLPRPTVIGAPPGTDAPESLAEAT
jgi:hypothetical protein